MSYVKMLGAVSPSVRGGSQVADMIAALAPPPAPVQGSSPPARTNSSASIGSTAMKFAPGAAGGVLGAMIWRDRPVLGFLVGHAIGGTALPFYRGDRTSALCQLALEGAGIAGAMYYKRSPVIGWAAGFALGALVTSFVPGSPIKAQLAELRSKF